MMDISVIMPMRNAAAYVREAARSVLAKTTVDLELIVVDDGSTDKSVALLHDLRDDRVRIIEGPQKGIAAAFNTGLAAATGEYVARCDADDAYTPARITQQVALLREHPEYIAVCGTYEAMDERSTTLRKYDCGTKAEEIQEELLSGVTRTHLATFAMRRDALVRLEGCREFFVTAEDIDLQLRLAEQGRIFYDPTSAYRYRLHDASVTHQQGDELRNFYERTARVFCAQRREHGEDDLQRGCPPNPPEIAGKRHSASRHKANLLEGEAWRLHNRGKRLGAIACGMRACVHDPAALSRWRSLAALCIKPSNAWNVTR